MTATASATVRDRLKEIRANVRELRDERAELAKDAREAAEAFAQTDTVNADLTSSPEFKRAKAAKDHLDECDGRLRQAQATELEVLSLLSGDVTAPAGLNGPEEGTNLDVVRQLKATPGALLSSVLESRKRDVSTLDNDRRFKAAAVGVSTDDISTATESQVIIDLLTPLSVARASGIITYPIDTTKTRIPRFTDLPVAEWVPEGGAFPKSAPGIEMVESKPPKVGLVTPLSVEVFDDLSPLAVSMIQVQILRALALAYDRGILFGSGEDEEPLGVANAPGVGEVAAPPLENLAAFAEALATLIGENARPGALVINPIDLGTLLQAVEFTGASESNVPLWKSSVNSVSGLALPYFNVPLWPTPACPQGTALLYDPSTIVAVVRKELDISVDPYYDLDHGEVGLRTYLRGDVVVGQPAGTVVITFGP